MAATGQLSQREADIQMMLSADVHLGTKNCDYQMQRYVHKRRNDGIYIVNLGKTWEKLEMAARVIVAIENPQDIIVQSARPYGQRAVLKFAQYTGVTVVQVDLFFYREPEEAKQEEDEEFGLPAPEYGLVSGGDQWPSEAEQPISAAA